VRKDSEDSDELFKDRTADEKITLYQTFFKRVKEDVQEILDDRDEQDQLEQDMKNLGEKITSYDSHRLRKIKRMGLTRIHKKFLE
jgi:gas vesicle protein